jgi:hypothetical protein
VGTEAVELGSTAGAKRFRGIFGSSSEREDASGRIWEKGVAHGREAARVAGCDLPPGLHWDVSARRGGSRVMSACEVWEVRGGGYLNIYPNEHIRGPRRGLESQARRLWPAGAKNAPH